MRIFVSGGAGFIGSAVIRQAIQDGHTVLNYDFLTYAACLANLDSVENHPSYRFVEGNIRDMPKVSGLLNDFKPHVLMHLAAESHVDRSIESPATFLETNIMGTYSLLEAARAFYESLKGEQNFRFHHVSTDEVFGSLGSDGLFSEMTAYDPRSPYSASKASSDHLVRAWYETYSLPIVLTNCSNNYGPYHFPEKLIPLVILNALHGKEIPVYGDGSNVRDWLFVEDHADALLLVADKGKIGRSYNIGGNNEAKNLEIVTKICDLLDKKRNKAKSHKDLITFVTDRPGHDARYAIDASRIRDELGWQPKTDLSKGLEQTVDWYLENEAWWRPLLEREGVGQRLGTLKS